MSIIKKITILYQLLRIFGVVGIGKMFYIINLINRSIKMKNWKTTVASIIQSLLLVIAIFGVNVGNGDANIFIEAIGSIYAVINVIKGYFTADKVPIVKK